MLREGFVSGSLMPTSQQQHIMGELHPCSPKIHWLLLGIQAKFTWFTLSPFLPSLTYQLQGLPMIFKQGASFSKRKQVKTFTIRPQIFQEAMKKHSQLCTRSPQDCLLSGQSHFLSRCFQIVLCLMRPQEMSQLRIICTQCKSQPFKEGWILSVKSHSQIMVFFSKYLTLLNSNSLSCTQFCFKKHYAKDRFNSKQLCNCTF